MQSSAPAPTVSPTKAVWLLTAAGFLSFFIFGFVDNLKGATLSNLLVDLDFSYAQGGSILFGAYLGFFISTLAAGFLADSVTLPVGADAATATPIFWGHGFADAAIPMRIAVKGRARLQEAGVPLMAMDYQIGHWIIPDQIHDAVQMVSSVMNRADPHIP